MVEVGIHACGCGEMKEHASELITMPCNDFALVVGQKSYRFQVDYKTGNLILQLINGVDCKFTTHNSYPALVLTKDDSPYARQVFEEK